MTRSDTFALGVIAKETACCKGYHISPVPTEELSMINQILIVTGSCHGDLIPNKSDPSLPNSISYMGCPPLRLVKL